MSRALPLFTLLLAAILVACTNASDPPTTRTDVTNAAPDASHSQTTPTKDPTVPTGQSVADNTAAGEHRATAVFAGGCFWCVEAVFEQLEGVVDAVSGYSGGTKETANYDDVCTGRTGHAEAVEIIYDPTKISYEKLLSVHFATHDPTTKNQQGADVGPQYRSTIFYASDSEKAAAEAMIKRLNDAGAFSRPIVTTLEPLKAFYQAERYHQNFVCDNPYQPYVQGVAMPKIAKVRKLFKDDLKKEAKP